MARTSSQAKAAIKRYKRLWRIRAMDWLLEHSYQGVMADRKWMGVQALKHPLDAWVYQEIIWDTKPDLILELGSRFGGSTLFLAHLLDLIGGAGRVLSIDISRDDYHVEHPRIDALTGSTQDSEIIETAREKAAGRRTMVIHDADHAGDAVLSDLRIYGPLVSSGCFLIVEDGLGDVAGGHDRGPLWATLEYLRETDDFVADGTREAHVLTYNPSGFLLRK